MVIREFDAKDQSKVQLLLQQNTIMTEAEIEQLLQTGQRLIALQDETVSGFAALTPGMPGAYSFAILVDPSQRRQGIGAALWRQLAATLASDTWLVCCTCPAQNTDGHAFLQAMSFASWFFEDLMHYSGPSLPDPELTARPYSDDDRFDWVRLINEGFYPLRHANDIVPYNVFKDDAANDPVTRQRLLSSDNDNLLFYDGEQLVGLAALIGSEIDPVTVVSDQRGKGYGRRIMAYCTNRILERGMSPVRLSVARINPIARRLYEGIGYQLVEQRDWFRLKLK